jgi:adenylylsulfate kinase
MIDKVSDYSRLGFTCWLTGLSGAGKSTISLGIAQVLAQQNIAHELLDGDVIRENLSKGLGFSKADRDINVLRVGFVCQLLNKHSVNTIAALISPYQETRLQLRQMLPNFIEVYVDCPIEHCIKRDPKGLYKRALSGEIKEFTGISSSYEPPISPDLILKTEKETVQESVNKVLDYLVDKKFIHLW